MVKLKQLFVSDAHYKLRIENGDKDMFAALSSGNDKQLEKIVYDRLKEVMDKQKAE